MRGDRSLESARVRRGDLTTVLAILDERRNNVVVRRTRLVNQLRSLLRRSIFGRAPIT